jgi:hypothetical protein
MSVFTFSGRCVLQVVRVSAYQTLDDVNLLNGFFHSVFELRIATHKGYPELQGKVQKQQKSKSLILDNSNIKNI